MAKDLTDVLKHIQENTITFKTTLLSKPKEKIVFRPIKTKDQKQLVVSKEEDEGKELANFETLISLIDSVLIEHKIEMSEWTLEDFISVLLDIKIKSVGQTVDLYAKCLHCGKNDNEVTLDFTTDVKKKTVEKISDNVIEISDKLKIIIGFLTVENWHTLLGFKEDEAKKLIALALMIKKIEFEGEVLDSLKLEDKLNIIEEFSKDQLMKFTKFDESNKLEVKAEKKFNCQNLECGKENVVIMSGFDLINFF